jgi:transcriptional regulator with XRE-family HTH domain
MLIWARQIKAARCLVGWQQLQLAVAAGVGIVTIRRIERMMGAISAQFETVEKIRRALEGAGVEFIGEPKPGVCVRPK